MAPLGRWPNFLGAGLECLPSPACQTALREQGHSGGWRGYRPRVCGSDPPSTPQGPADQSPLSLRPPNRDPGACSLTSPSVLQSPPWYTSPSSVPALPKASRGAQL